MAHVVSEYQNLINGMLPNNLTAYTTLSWNLIGCYMRSYQPLEALQVVKAIAFNNPGNIEVQQRANYNMAIIHLRQSGPHMPVNAVDMDLLSTVAGSKYRFLTNGLRDIANANEQ